MTPEQVREIVEKEGLNTEACLIYPRGVTHGALSLTYGNDSLYHVSNNDRDGFDEVFGSESDACTFFLKTALSDPTLRRDFKQSDLLNWDERRQQLLNKYGLR
jgi:hypothetical protein